MSIFITVFTHYQTLKHFKNKTCCSIFVWSFWGFFKIQNQCLLAKSDLGFKVVSMKMNKTILHDTAHCCILSKDNKKPLNWCSLKLSMWTFFWNWIAIIKWQPKLQLLNIFQSAQQILWNNLLWVAKYLNL